MKQIPAALVSHYQLDATTTCLLTRVRCKNGTLLGFTDLDVDVVYDPAAVDPGGTGDDWGLLTHVAENGGLTMARMDAGADLTVDNTELSGVVNDTGITEAQIRAGLFDYAQVRIYRVNYMDLSQGHELVAAGTAGETQFSENGWRTEFRSLVEQLKQPVIDLYSLTCSAKFGDAKCGKVFTWESGTVTSVGTDTQRSFTADITPANDYYALGVVEWLTGANAGAQMEVDSNTGGAFNLSLPMAYAVAVGDTFRVRKDCNKVWDDASNGCSFHWGADRANHFRGFPDIPVADGGASMIPGAQISRA